MRNVARRNRQNRDRRAWLGVFSILLSLFAVSPQGSVNAFVGLDGEQCTGELSLPAGTISISNDVDDGVTPDDFELLIVDEMHGLALMMGPGNSAPYVPVTSNGSVESDDAALCEFDMGGQEGEPGQGVYQMILVPSDSSGLDPNEFVLPTRRFVLQNVGDSLVPADGRGTALPTEYFNAEIQPATSRIAIQIAGVGDDPYTTINPAEASGVVCLTPWQFGDFADWDDDVAGEMICDLLGASGDGSFLEFNVDASLVNLDDLDDGEPVVAASHVELSGTVDSAQGYFTSWDSAIARTYGGYVDSLTNGIDRVAVFGSPDGGDGCGGPQEGDLTGTVTAGGQPVECVSINVGSVDGNCCAGYSETDSSGGYYFEMPAQFDFGDTQIAIDEGDYLIYFEPGGFSVADHEYSVMSHVITWDGSAITQIDGAPAGATPTLDVALPETNLLVQVSDGTTGVGSVHTGIERLQWNDDSGQWDWAPGGSVWRRPTREQQSPDDDGVVGFYLPAAESGFDLYRFQVQPSGSDGLTSQQISLAVSSEGAIGVCTETPETSDVTTTCSNPLPLDENDRWIVTLTAGNVTGTVTTPGESGTASSWGWINARSLSDDCEIFWDPSCDSGTNTSEAGTFSLNLTDGDWRLTVEPGWEDRSSYTSTVFDVTVSGGVVTAAQLVSGGGVSLIEGALSVTLGTPNFLAVVQSGGSGVGDVWVSTSTWDTERGYWTGGQGGSNSQSDGPGTDDDASVGIIGMSLTDQLYRLELNPPWDDDAGLVRTEVIIDPAFNESSAITAINVCADVTYDEQQTPSCDQPTALSTAEVAGVMRWVLEMPGANFSGNVCRPGTGDGEVDCIGVRDVWVELQAWNDNWMNFEWAGGTNTRSRGAFGLSIDTPADDETVYYKVTANPPWNNPDSWTRVSRVFKATESSGDLVLEECTADGDLPSETCSEASLVNAAFVFALRASTQRGTVLSPEDGTAIANAWVEVFQEDEFGGDRWLSGTQSNRNGQFGLDLTEGEYTLRVNPPGQGADGLTAGETAVVVAANGDIISPDPFVVYLSMPNVIGTVEDGLGNPVSRAWINVEVDNGQYYEWYPAWGETDSSGEFRLSLEAGTYRVTVNPPERLAGTYSAVRETITVADSTSIVEPIFVLGTPTLSGSVLAGSDPVPYTHIDVASYDDFMGDFMWANIWANTGPRGRYALNLDPGRYRITANPGGSANYSRSNTFVLVANGTASLCDDASDDECTTTIANGALDLALSSPNLSGTLTYGSGTPAPRSWINVQQWNDSWGNFEWVDLWADTRSNGTYSMNIDQPGTYRLEYNPSPSIEALGYTRTEAYVIVEYDGATQSLKWCEFASEAAALAAEDCDSTTFGTALDVSLRGANFSGLLEFEGTAVGDTWVELQTWNSSWNNWEWTNGGAQVSRTGRFSMRLASTSGEPELRRLTVNPPWNNPNNLGRTSLIIWVDDFNADDTDDWCRAVDPSADFVDVANSCVSGVATTDGSTYTIEMAGANVTGTLTAPDGTTGIRNSHLNVERYEDVPWSDEDQLQWVDVHANTTSTGGFAINLEEAGTYRITGWPSWNNPNGYTRGYTEIVVDGNGDWCLPGDVTDAVCDAPGTSLNVSLTGSNFQAIVYQDTTFTTGQTVRDAWVDIEQKVTNGDDTFWTWTGGGSPTNANGVVSLRLDPPTSGNREFRLSVNPPWSGGGTASLARFTVELTIDSNGDIVSSTPELAEDANGRVQLGFPGTSVVGNVCATSATADCSGSGIANSWVAVFDSNGDWVDAGTSTNRRGEFRLALDDGTWTLEANPSWDNPTGMRTRVTVTVAGGQVTGCTGCVGASTNPINIALSTANVTGTVSMTDTRANSWAWVEVLDGVGNFVDGAPTDQNGRFQLGLADGTYVLRMFPNWSLGAAPPMDINVTVASGAISDWDYAGYTDSDDCGNGDGADTCAITVSFASDRASSPNVSGAVTLDSAAASGVFIVVRSGLNTTTGTVLSQFTTLSDASGNYKLSLPNGEYTVTALNPVDGGTAVHQNVTVNDDSQTVDIALASPSL